MQVYRGMDIGTAKPDAASRRRYGYHLIDLVEPSQDLSVAEYQARGARVIDELADAGEHVILAGGSGLHLRALVDPLEFPPTDGELRSMLEAATSQSLVEELISADSGAGDVMDLANPRRVLRAVEVLRLTGETPSSRVVGPQATAVRRYVPSRPFVGIGVDPGGELAERVTARFDSMLASGLLAEVAALRPVMGRTARQAVGYKELIGVVTGEASLEEGSAEAIWATMALAKRQRTFFGRDPRISWISWHHDPNERLAAAWSQLEGLWTS
jgi:tRNA dimethylallyltransferase